jgi:DNA polymerase III gamma/tau subunit
VFSSSISIGDAIKAASKLKSDLKIAQIDLEISDTKNTLSEVQMLHSAAHILRRDIKNLLVVLRQIHDTIVTPGRFEMALLHFYSMILLSVSDMHFRIFSIGI